MNLYGFSQTEYGDFSGRCFPVFGLSMEIYFIIFVFSPHTGKYRPEKPPYLDTFHAVEVKALSCSYGNSLENVLIRRYRRKHYEGIFMDWFKSCFELLEDRNSSIFVVPQSIKYSMFHTTFDNWQYIPTNQNIACIYTRYQEFPRLINNNNTIQKIP